MSMISFDNEYANWINELKQRFRNTQIKAALKVNSEMRSAARIPWSQRFFGS